MKTVRVYEQAKCPKDKKAIKVFDSHGLYMHVFRSGSKVWKHQFRYEGKIQMVNIGEYPMVSLTQAREKHAENRRLLAGGVNPASYRGERAAADLESFEQLARDWFKHYKDNGVKEATWTKTESRLNTYLIPALGKLKPASIDTKMVADAIRAIGKKAVTVAAVAFQDLNMIFSWAISNGRASNNPANGIRLSDLVTIPETKNRAALKPAEMPALVKAIRGYKSEQTKAACLLLAHTATRTRELTESTWQEYDLDAAMWIVPAERTKKCRDLCVPLSQPVVAILRDLKAVNGHSQYVLRGQGKAGFMSEKTILNALDVMGFKGVMTGHGFRSVFSSFLNEGQKAPKHLIEYQLAHVTGSKTELAYNRAEYIEERREMMNLYSAWLESMK